ncbi:MAG: prepilin-type N-terminal cleavage/methylation domain-containing protein [Acidobacteriota bacterium]
MTKRGFSLIELLVVVVILGVIVVASIPAISRYLPRWRLDRVAENLCQAVRTARNGAVTAHCNHILRFWNDFNRTIPAVGTAVAYDVLLDRNSNMVFDAQAGVPDKILAFRSFYKDVQIQLDPGVTGRQPYTNFNQAPASFIFRPDGRVYTFQAGAFQPITSADGAVAVESLTLPNMSGNPNDLAMYRYRIVAVDPYGSVRLISRGDRGN